MKKLKKIKIIEQLANEARQEGKRYVEEHFHEQYGMPHIPRDHCGYRKGTECYKAWWDSVNKTVKEKEQHRST